MHSTPLMMRALGAPRGTSNRKVNTMSQGSSLTGARSQGKAHAPLSLARMGQGGGKGGQREREAGGQGVGKRNVGKGTQHATGCKQEGARGGEEERREGYAARHRV